MKKILSAFAVALASAVALAEGTTVNTDVITGTDGVLQTVQNYISAVATGAWPIIVTIVGVGLLIWLGRAMIRAVRSYFSTSM